MSELASRIRSVALRLIPEPFCFAGNAGRWVKPLPSSKPGRKITLSDLKRLKSTLNQRLLELEK